MDRVTIPNTTLDVSRLCLGTSDLGTAVAEPDAFALLDMFVELGGNFLDTALVYANWIPGELSVSEKTLGAWMKARRNRDTMVVATKGAHPDLSTMHISRLSPADITADVETSLRNLKVSAIDLYYLHRDDVMRPVEEIIDTLYSLVQSGKLRFVGCSNWCAGRIEAAQAYAKTLGFEGFVADQMLWNLAMVDPSSLEGMNLVAMDPDLRRYHATTGMAAVPYSSQAGGLFQKMAAGRLDGASAGLRRMYPEPANAQRYARVEHLCHETGLSVSEVVLAYLLSQPFVTVPVVGCKTQAHLRDTVAAASARLTPVQIAYLERGEHADPGICAS